MSYEPVIICEYDELDSAKEYIEIDYHCGGMEEARFLLEVLKGRPIELHDRKLVVFRPECSTFNSEVRGYLDGLVVPYGVGDVDS